MLRRTLKLSASSIDHHKLRRRLPDHRRPAILHGHPVRCRDLRRFLGPLNSVLDPTLSSWVPAMTSMTSPDAASTEMVFNSSRTLAEAALALGITSAVYAIHSAPSAPPHRKTVRDCVGVAHPPRPPQNATHISEC